MLQNIITEERRVQVARIQGREIRDSDARKQRASPIQDRYPCPLDQESAIRDRILKEAPAEG